MAKLADVRAALATNLGAIDGIQSSAHILSNPTLPTAWVYPAEIDYDEAMGRGLDRLELVIEVFVGLVTDIGAQQLLDGFFDGTGPSSIKEKVEADSTLGGVCDDLRVTKASGYRAVTVEGRGPYLMAEWRVEVWAPGE